MQERQEPVDEPILRLVMDAAKGEWARLTTIRHSGSPTQTDLHRRSRRRRRREEGTERSVEQTLHVNMQK
jgi:hypothetical protein